MVMDCIPCMMRQIVDAARRAAPAENIQRRILAEVGALLAREMPDIAVPIILNEQMNQIVTRLTGVEDPYREVKEQHIKGALTLYPRLREAVIRASDPLLAALQVSATGNILDIVINAQVQVETDVADILQQGFALCALEDFRRLLAESRDILILGDNAGETVFDRLLLEQLGDKKITYAVKEAPIINDATVEDALASGLDQVADVVSAGCRTAGTVLEQCSAEFRRLFAAADLVVAKGMGNYEVLSQSEKPIFFLLKAKCLPVAQDIGVPVGELVFARRQDMVG